MLARLSIAVQEAANLVSKAEQKIINDFQMSKERILQKVIEILTSHRFSGSIRASFKNA